jgi:cobalamin biosynthesis protein CobT
MATKDKEEKQSGFVVNDRRLFGDDGELRQDVVEAEERAAERERAANEAQQRANEEREAQQKAAQPEEPPTETLPEGEGPTTEEHKASADAYAETTKKMDYRIRKELDKQGRTEQARDLEMSFEKFVASLYMTTLMQLGLAAPQGEKPMLDLMGARQTIDILGILNDKTKGNLTSAEESTLRNVLYELRMAYLEVTNLIANPPKDGVPPAK